MGFMPEDWLHHNISVPCPVQCNIMCPLNVEMSSATYVFVKNALNPLAYTATIWYCYWSSY